MKYSEQLLTENWIKKRNKILCRDSYKCNGCRSSKNLEVHHKKYIQGKNAWEVPNSYLITLCRDCHRKVHFNKNISDFVVKNKKAKTTKKLSKSERVTKRIDKMYDSLSDKDLELQRRYDKLKTKPSH